ncbi:MAG: hypothetical protein ACREUA_00300, partial [Burkholderiales bacterium]
EGVTLHENPFPVWLREALEAARLRYNTVNFCYQGAYRTLDDAEKMRTWFDGQFRLWIVQEKKADQPFVDKLLVRVSDDSMDSDLSQFDSY